jgi:hypothetical protein
MIESSLFHLHTGCPQSAYVGCGVVIEGGYLATCRHVWEAAIAAWGEEPVAVFPRVLEDRKSVV